MRKIIPIDTIVVKGGCNFGYTGQQADGDEAKSDILQSDYLH